MLWSSASPLRLSAKIFDYAGLTAAIGVIIWHSIARGHWQPMSDNFDTIIWLAILLCMMLPPHLLVGKDIKDLHAGDSVWMIVPAASLLMVMLLWLTGGVGFSRVHPLEAVAIQHEGVTRRLSRRLKINRLSADHADRTRGVRDHFDRQQLALRDRRIHGHRLACEQ